MAGEYRNSVGFLDLQLRAQREKDLQQQAFQREQMAREDRQFEAQNSLALGRQAALAFSGAQDRKLQLAAMLQKAAQDAETRKALQDAKDAAAAPERDSKITKNEAQSKLYEAQTATIPVDDVRADADTASKIADRDTLHGDRVRGQDMSFLGNVAGKFATPDVYGKRALQLDDSFLSRLGKTLASGKEEPVPQNEIPAYRDSSSVPPLSDAALDAAKAEASKIWGGGAQPVVDEAPPLKMAETPVPNPDVKAIDTDKATVDLAMKNMVQGQSTLSAFKKAREELAKIPEGDFGFLARDKELRLPAKLPFLGGVGVTIPGRNSLEEGAVDMNLADSTVGRKLIQSIRGDADKSDPGVGAIKGRVVERDRARRAAQDLSSQISLMRLGTTSTAAQDARIDRILGMLNDDAFGRNKARTLAIMGDAEKEVQRLQRYYQFIAENHMLPVGEIPDPEELEAKSVKAKQKGLPPLTPSGM
jgi:hypothetical protein